METISFFKQIKRRNKYTVPTVPKFDKKITQKIVETEAKLKPAYT